MNLKSTAMAVALSAFGAVSAQAATVGDFDADGSSDVMFQMLNVATGQTFSWDLSLDGDDLTSDGFYRNLPGDGVGIPDEFSLTNAALDAFIGDNAPNNLRWRVVGVGAKNSVDRAFGALTTGVSMPVVTTPARSFSIAVWNNLLQNSGTGGLDADGIAGTADDTKIFTSGNAIWSTLPEPSGGTTNYLTGFGAIQLFWVHRPESIATLVNDPMQIDLVGSFRLDWDAALGRATLAYAVPLPTAAWLFGSALVGLAGLTRRKSA